MTETRLRSVDAAALAEAAAVLRAGGLVAFPTETVYGLGANALDAAAVARIFAAKGRPANNPIIVHIADFADLPRVVANWPDAARRLAERFWPGPLTLVLPRAAAVPDIVTAGGPTVAVRMPAHPVALALIRAAGVPLAAPSANRSGELSPTTAEHVRRSLSSRIDMILGGGPTQVGLESTVVDLSVTPVRLLRPGHISPADIATVIGAIARQPDVSEAAPLPSPGMLARHYAPRTPTVCLAGSATYVAERLQRGEKVGWLTFDAAPCDAVTVVMPRAPTEYAARLYAELHALDQLALDRIVVEQPPDEEPWLAVGDRLSRAAIPTSG
ncbi:MAG: L-threonylcarbamoyladenylate synthase [Gemmataceae bacterium]